MKLSLKHGSEEWHKYRSSRIGSSDIAAICGVSPWKSDRQVYFEKLGIHPPTQINERMARGITLEPLAIKYFEEFTGQKVEPEVWVHDECDYLFASFDGIGDDCISNTGKIVVEVKCPSEKNHKKTRDENYIPEYYIYQMQLQMMVANVNQMYFFSFDGRHGIIIPVKADLQIQSKIMENAILFKHRLDNLEPPDKKVETREDDITTDLIREYEFEKEKSDIQEARLKDAKQRLIDHANGKSFQCKDTKVQWISPTQFTDWNKINAEVLKDLKVDMSQYKKEKAGFWSIKMKKEGRNDSSP